MNRTKLRNIKAVIFDFDGTLAVLNIDFSSMRERVLDLMKQFGVDKKSIREKYTLELIDEVCQILLKKNDSNVDEFYRRAHLILHRIEMEAAGQGRLIPGTEETLRTLRAKRIKVGIVTRNCADAVLKVFPDIETACDVFVSRNSVKHVKPHPDHLLHVMEAFQILGEEAIMIGDHTLDIQAGKRVGMKTIGVLTGRIKREEFEKTGADFILENASEICGLLED